MDVTMCLLPRLLSIIYWKHSFFWRVTVVCLVFWLCERAQFGAASLAMADSAPTWVGPMLRLEYSLLAGDELELECRARGRPRPTVQWYKDERLLTNSSRSNTPPIIFTKWRLIVPNLVSVQDEGTYTCIVSNKHGQLQHSYRVIVVVRHIDPPKFSRKPRNATVTAGEKIVLHCEADSELNIFTQWLKRVEVNDTKETVHFRRVEPEGRVHLSDNQLTIVNSTQNDSGSYVCYIANQKGSVQAEARVTVRAPATSGNALNSSNVFFIPVLTGSVVADIAILVATAVVLVCFLKYRKKKARQSPRSTTRCTTSTAATTSTARTTTVQLCESGDDLKETIPLETLRDDITAV